MAKSCQENGDTVHQSQCNNERTLINRRTSTGPEEKDENPSLRKRLRIVQFRDDDETEHPDENQPQVTDKKEKVIHARRGEILSFRVKDEKEE